MHGRSSEGSGVRDPFARWTHPGVDWLDERPLPRDRSALVETSFGPEARVEAALILTQRALRAGRWRRERVSLRRAKAHLEAAVSSRPGYLPGLRLLSSLLFMEGELEAGMDALKRSCLLDPPSSARLRADGALILLEHARLDEAAALLDAFTSESRGDPWFELASAVFDREAGYPSLALDRFRPRAVGESTGGPSDDSRRFERARTHWRLGSLSDAVADLRRLSDRRPGCLVSRRNLVLALHASGRLDEARVQYERARPSLRVDPELRALLRGPQPTADEEGSALRGDLSLVALTDVLNLLGHSRSTGVLVLDSPAGRGEIELWDGKLVDVATPGAADEAAGLEPEARVIAGLQSLLEWESGAFELRKRPGARHPSSVAIDTPVALLHACASLDERRRDEPRRP